MNVRAGQSIGDRLRCSLVALSSELGKVVGHDESPWSSITFSGTRHELTLTFEGIEAVEAGERFVEALPEHEFRIPGHLVADASVREVDHRFGQTETLRVTCVLLLLEES